jgi:hypothetical protein
MSSAAETIRKLIPGGFMNPRRQVPRSGLERRKHNTTLSMCRIGSVKRGAGTPVCDSACQSRAYLTNIIGID